MFLSEEADQFELPVQEISFTREELEELLSFLESKEPVNPNSGSEGSAQVVSFLESNEPINPNYGPEGSTRAVYSADERKKRRMVSNRESARRSRRRKRVHLENITDEVNRLSIENQQIKNRLSWVINQYHSVWRENEALRSESVALWAKLLDL
ncbi:transcription factor bHLH74-like isoform X1 [Hibiscus syriacus]|uniref:Transcription factor bHLH74-like isoform X1 n=1 Tax=Hibiscus syriacus TaxID=106335 RepID=A0A6A3BF14_HIBSY|nr:basic leucine zipper 4-like [Hibiscus syriacus]KAE8715626.1 transcription factor bHLH74-like isoform X1 [Hibiscus syriacus]